jgi:DNA topoisomerase-2
MFQQFQLGQLQRELEKLSNQARFVQMIIDGELVISKKAKSLLIKELRQKGFKPIPKAADPAKQGETAEYTDDEEEAASEAAAESGADIYDYLLGVSTKRGFPFRGL